MEDKRILSVVKRFHAQKGYGFIVGPEDEDVFFHFSHIEMEGYKTLKKGQSVRYTLVHTERGPQAHNIEPL